MPDNIVARLHRRVRAALQHSGLVGDKLLAVAVSGGPDSLALLHALHALQAELGLSLHGAHLNHRLRGDASDADAAFVAETLRGLGLPFTLEEAEVASLRRERRLSLEEAAREVRYAFLARVAAQQGAHAVALGHTADDQAETVLMNIIRGAGITGLRGMAPLTRRALGDDRLVLVRPLLGVTRQETEDYCRARGLEPRQDASNLSLEPRRNRVRMELLPILEGYNPAIRDAILRLSRSAARDTAYIEGEIEKVWGDIARQEQGRVSLDRDRFLRLPPALQSHLLRRAVSVAKGDAQDLEQNHIEDMVRLMAGPAGTSLHLPGGIRFTVSYGEATLAPSERDPCPFPPLEGEHSLQVPGETLLSGWRVVAEVWEPRHADSPRGLTNGSSYAQTPDFSRGKGNAPRPYVASLDYNSVGRELWVRWRRPGDRFQPLGMQQAKKLQDFMVDSKIPRLWRDRIPLVASPKGIAWVVGWRIAQWAAVKETGGTRLRLRFEPRD